MIFLDTSAIYALADRADANHDRAREQFESALESGAEIATHNYTLIESLALLQARLGLPSARAFAESIDSYRVIWVNDELHRAAAKRWSQGRRAISFVDQVSFLVMERHDIEIAFAFDPDFERAGFRLLGAS